MVVRKQGMPLLPVITACFSKKHLGVEKRHFPACASLKSMGFGKYHHCHIVWESMKYKVPMSSDQTKAVEKPQVQHWSAMPDTSWIHHRFGFQLISVYCSETSYCCQIFATHPHPTSVSGLLCQVMAHSLRTHPPTLSVTCHAKY